jgi:hypothetical protein
MKVEHTLAPAMQAYIKQALEALNQNRREYLQALGMAKELEMRAQTLQNALSEQLGIIQRTENLPAPIGQYRLNEDGSKMIGETADPPAAMPAPVIEPEVLAAAPRMVNGV